MNIKTRGFITVATGKEHYYKLAHNLVTSYRLFNGNQFPFSIITEKENPYTSLFDSVIIVEDATHSYLDKFLMDGNLPYDENIFIEADMLAYGDISFLFDYFKNADDFSCLGGVHHVSKINSGWFRCDKLPYDYRYKVNYTVDLHGGILYMKNTPLVHHVFDTAKEIVKRAEEFASSFKEGAFRSLADEPILAISMAVNHCHPIRREKSFLSYYPKDRIRFVYNIEKRICAPKRRMDDRRVLLHWGTSFTFIPKYAWEIYRLECMCANQKSRRTYNAKFFIKQLNYRVKCQYSNMMDSLQQNKTITGIWRKMKVFLHRK